MKKSKQQKRIPTEVKVGKPKREVKQKDLSKVLSTTHSTGTTILESKYSSTSLTAAPASIFTPTTSTTTDIPPTPETDLPLIDLLPNPETDLPLFDLLPIPQTDLPPTPEEGDVIFEWTMNELSDDDWYSLVLNTGR